MTHKITIVMPIYNGTTTLERVFAGLEGQENKELIDKIIFINDHSSDKSLEVLQLYVPHSAYNAAIIDHKKSRGLAGSYNEGIGKAQTEYVILMHQDIVLTDKKSFSKIIAPFQSEKVAATYPVLLHPYEVWREYSFWQKCLFSRHVGKKIPMLTGKFDCFSKSKLEELGYFDPKIYRTAGEDSDLKIRIKNKGFTTVDSGVEVVHLQYAEKNFSLKRFIKKEAQLAEAQGVILRKYGVHDPKGVALAFFREILLLGLLVPYARMVFGVLILVYAAVYTKLVYREEYRNPRILALPFINIFLLFVSLFASARGFVRGRQVI